MNFNDRWSQTLDQRYDQDGNVFIIDWYDKQQCHNQRDPQIHDRSNGRIYKIVYGDKKATQVDLGKATDADLVKLQLSNNDWQARHARRLLQERTQFVFTNEGPDGKGGTKVKFVPEPDGDLPGTFYIPANRRAIHESLRKVLADTVEPTHQLRALWALHVTKGLEPAKGPSPAATLDQLKSKTEQVRAWTVQLLNENKKPGAAALAEFARLAKEDPSPLVRLYLASACQRLTVAERAPIVEALLAHAEDATDHNLPLMYWYATEPIVAADPAQGALLLAKAKIPVVREYITRRLTAK
jgi:hypothetical protein